MSEMETTQGGSEWDEEEDCPLCLEPLPFWDVKRRLMAACCGKAMCRDCYVKQNAYLNRAVAGGSFGRQEEQLQKTCPLCRAPMPKEGDLGNILLERFENGQLPLTLYRNLAIELVDGQGVLERNVERGVEIWRLGAEKGDPNCQFWIGHKYREGTDGFSKSTIDAKRWYLAAAEQGHAPAEYNLAVILRDEGDDAQYLRYLRGSASKGYNQACYNLGVACFKGEHGLQMSSEEAIRVVTPAAERGDAKSMCLLGLAMCCPEYGMLIVSNPNFTKGMHWIRRAAEKGYDTAISHLKEMEELASSRCYKCAKEAPPEKSFLRCSRCRAAWYCSKDCQVEHWKAEEAGHKQFCIKWK